jgi:hypothetical protein
MPSLLELAALLLEVELFKAAELFGIEALLFSLAPKPEITIALLLGAFDNEVADLVSSTYSTKLRLAPISYWKQEI